MSTSTLFEPFDLAGLWLPNRVVMAPMSRVRGTADGRATEAMAQHFADRADAGLLVTDGAQPNRQGQANPRSAGLADDAQAASWRPVTTAVHRAGGRIVAQLMHGGRISHPSTTGVQPVGPSAVAARGTTVFTDAGPQPAPVPRALSTSEAAAEAEVYAAAARRGVGAGFDGVELHGANGYLISQFLSPAANHRGDRYGGGVTGRIRFAVEAAAAAADAVGAHRVGIRLSPGVGLWDTAEDDVPGTYRALLAELARLDLAYVHLVVGDPALFGLLRTAWPGALVVNPHTSLDGPATDRAEAERWRAAGADLVSFGRAFIAHPDLVSRLRTGAPLAAADPATFYTGGERGYTDLPVADTRA